MMRPRVQHYRFAHKLMPGLFGVMPHFVMERLAREGDKFLRELWERGAILRGDTGRVSPDGLESQVRRLEDGTLVGLITLPTPQAMPEAYFVVLVYLGSAREGTRQTRYLTLEHSIGPDDSSKTVLGEWIPHAHLYYGGGPAATLEDFFLAVCGLVTGATSDDKCSYEVWAPGGGG